MGHQHRRVTMVLPGPAQQQSPVGQLIYGTDIKHPWIELGQQANQLLKLPVVFQRFIIIGNGFAAHQLGQGIYRRVPVKAQLLPGQLRLGLGAESQRAHQNHTDQYCQQSKNNHITALLSYIEPVPRQW